MRPWGPLPRSLVSGVRMVAATFHPRSAKVRAVAMPMPLDAPVMRTVFPVILPPAAPAVLRRRRNDEPCTGPVPGSRG